MSKEEKHNPEYVTESLCLSRVRRIEEKIDSQKEYLKLLFGSTLLSMMLVALQFVLEALK